MSHPAVDDLDLDIRDGELLVLVGPSGCGKSTVLRMLAGLEPVDVGRILIDGVDVTAVLARERDVAMVFQAYALYPKMTVAENIGFHLQLSHVPFEEIRCRVDATAELLGIGDLLDRMPSKLSGGQRQRVAMGRALIREPKVFLMDEPLSNLDAKLRIHMRTEIAALQKRLGTTTLYVTHDQVEAMTLGDRVAVQRDGVLQQCAPPMELYAAPINEFVAGFIGSPAMNLIPAHVDAGLAVAGELRHRLTQNQVAALTTDRVTLGVRPEAWHFGACEGLDVQIEVVETLGSEVLLHCSTPTLPNLVVHVADLVRVNVGDRRRLSVEPDLVHVFDSATSLRLRP